MILWFSSFGVLQPSLVCGSAQVTVPFQTNSLRARFKIIALPSIAGAA
jgi:hypothetical protein